MRAESPEVTLESPGWEDAPHPSVLEGDGGAWGSGYQGQSLSITPSLLSAITPPNTTGVLLGFFF